MSRFGLPHCDQTFRLQVGSPLNPRWLDEFPIIATQPGARDRSEPLTTLVLRVVDQSQMMGILNEMHGMGVALVSLERVLPNQSAGQGRVET
ncbi:MAG: hypothetical protein KIS91_13435 [Anaerolineae bacterium]|mgnify:CR=1 FL=1|nr:hypothetical protein [Anaerolineae bacterium]